MKEWADRRQVLSEYFLIKQLFYRGLSTWWHLEKLEETSQLAGLLDCHYRIWVTKLVNRLTGRS